jgi:hypothetical protein
MTLYLKYDEFEIEIYAPGYKLKYEVLYATVHFSVPEELWDHITDLAIEGDYDEHMSQIRTLVLQKLRKVTTIIGDTKKDEDLGRYMNLSKIEELVTPRIRPFLFQCYNLKKLSTFIYFKDFSSFNVLLQLNQFTLVELDITGYNIYNAERTVFRNSFQSLTRLKRLSIKLSLLDYDFSLLHHVKELTLYDFDFEQMEQLKMFTRSTYHLRRLEIQLMYGRQCPTVEDLNIIAQESPYLSQLKCSAYNNLIHENKRRNDDGDQRLLTLLCLKKYKHKQIGELKHFCKVIGEYTCFIR